MRTERNMKILAIVAIVLAVGGLSIGFASVSTMLSISNTTASVTPANFNVNFNNLLSAVTTGSATASTPTFTAGTTNIDGISITLQNPGDSVTYTFDVVNSGTMDAILQNIDKADQSAALPADQLTCTGSGVNAATDAANVCGDLEYTFTYAADDAVVSANDTLDIGETRTVNLTLTYNPADATTFPDESVAISNLDISLDYIQNR